VVHASRDGGLDGVDICGYPDHGRVHSAPAFTSPIRPSASDPALVGC
jgi:hypothetical protein